MAASRKRNDKVIQGLQRKAAAHESATKRVVGYTRVSTEDQAEDGAGLEYQRDAIEAFVKSQRWELVTIIEDAGISGASRPDGRPGFSQVRALAEARAIDAVLVWRFDRLARDIGYAVTTSDELMKSYEVGVKSVTEPIDTSDALGKLIFSVLAGMGGLEREAIARRTWEGRKAKAEKGGFAGGQVPYGYQLVDGELTLHPDEAEVVRIIFQLRRQKKGARTIAKALNEQSIPTRSGRQWNPSTIAGILDNPRYQGYVDFVFGKKGLAQQWGAKRVNVEGQHEAILPKAPKRVG